MKIDRVYVKQNAKQIIRLSKPSLLAAGLALTVLSAIIGYLSLKLTGIDLNSAMEIMNAGSDGRAELAASLLTQSMPTGFETLLDLLLRLALEIVGVGFSLFVINTVRKTEPALGNLLDGFSMMPRLLVLLILEYVFITLWSLLFIVPGIVAAYRYSFAVYIMIDHPEMSAMDCIRESKKRTSDYKGQLFALDLSFLPWLFLCVMPVIGYAVQIYVSPYMETAKVLYYETICRKDEGFEEVSA